MTYELFKNGLNLSYDILELVKINIYVMENEYERRKR
jgi:hypothetical protein